MCGFVAFFLNTENALNGYVGRNHFYDGFLLDSPQAKWFRVSLKSLSWISHMYIYFFDDKCGGPSTCGEYLRL